MYCPYLCLFPFLFFDILFSYFLTLLFSFCYAPSLFTCSGSTVPISNYFLSIFEHLTLLWVFTVIHFLLSELWWELLERDLIDIKVIMKNQQCCTSEDVPVRGHMKRLGSNKTWEGKSAKEEDNKFLNKNLLEIKYQWKVPS